MNEKKILGILMKQNQNRDCPIPKLKFPDYLIFLTKLGGGAATPLPAPLPASYTYGNVTKTCMKN